MRVYTVPSAVATPRANRYRTPRNVQPRGGRPWTEGATERATERAAGRGPNAARRAPAYFIALTRSAAGRGTRRPADVRARQRSIERHRAALRPSLCARRGAWSVVRVRSMDGAWSGSGRPSRVRFPSPARLPCHARLTPTCSLDTRHGAEMGPQSARLQRPRPVCPPKLSPTYTPATRPAAPPPRETARDYC